MLAVSEHLRQEARDLNLCIWSCDWQFKNKDPVLAAGTNVVAAALMGPGLPVAIWGSGKTADEAVKTALQRVEARSRGKGLSGALARLEDASSRLSCAVQMARWKSDPESLDDDIPF